MTLKQVKPASVLIALLAFAIVMIAVPLLIPAITRVLLGYSGIRLFYDLVVPIALNCVFCLVAGFTLSRMQLMPWMIVPMPAIMLLILQLFQNMAFPEIYKVYYLWQLLAYTALTVPGVVFTMWRRAVAQKKRAARHHSGQRRRRAQ